MTFTAEQIEEIESLAGINYTIKQMAMYFNIPVNELQREFENKESSFRFHYDRGQLMAQAQVDMKVLESAKGGNMTAQQQIEKIRAARQFENIRDQLLYGNS
jgi:ABC-type uncharacterized transport system ATPase subunit